MHTVGLPFYRNNQIEVLSKNKSNRKRNPKDIEKSLRENIEGNPPSDVENSPPK